MMAAYSWRAHVDQTTPWSSGLIVIGREPSAEKSTLEGAIPARLRLLSSSEFAELSLFATGDLAGDKAIGVKGRVREKLIELSPSKAGFSAAELQSGRLPEAGRNEVLAGAKIGPRESLKVGGQSLTVVGVLNPGVALLADSFLIPPDDANDRVFPAAVPSVLHAWLVRVAAEELRDATVRKRLEDVFPAERYAWVTGEDRLEPRWFELYLSGLAVFLLGGSGALIALFRWLAGKVTIPVTIPALSGPLLEMKARPHLVWAMHLAFFGLVIAGSLLASGAPEAQVVLLGKAREAFATESNPLGLAAQAYRSGSIPLAAFLTFVINFVLGSLACITLPSIVLPGIGVLLLGIRAVAWGLIAAPATHTLALAMLPHSVTLLLEGEGYILATLFGLLIPIHVLRRSLGGNMLTRFGRVLLLNLEAQFWIVWVLAVAAIYEATELIWLNR
jgi:hypothetical protein